MMIYNTGWIHMSKLDNAEIMHCKLQQNNKLLNGSPFMLSLNEAAQVWGMLFCICYRGNDLLWVFKLKWSSHDDL